MRRAVLLATVLSGGSPTYARTNLKLDLDARAGLIQTSGGSTPATADGDPVGKWTDQQSSLNVVQVTAGSRPILKLNQVNALPSVRFDGVDDFLSSSGFVSSAIMTASAFECFAVFNAGAIDGANVSAYKNDGVITDTGFWGLTLKNTPDAWIYNDSTGEKRINTAISLSTWTIINMRLDSGALVISKNGGAESSTATGNTSRVDQAVYIGNSVGAPNNYLTGDITRILFYNAVLSSGDRSSTIAYLKGLYGIS